MKVKILAYDLFELTALVYSKWAMAFDNLKAVKAETNTDGSDDWEEFHKERLVNAKIEFERWKSFLDRMKAICPKIGE